MLEPLKNVELQHKRLSDQVKDVLKQAILDGHFKQGDKLPPEDQVAKKFKVSKVTAREALREMESEGLIEKRRGIYGGSFVAQPGSDRMGQVVINYYHFGGMTVEELVEFRKILEPTLVTLAAERRTDEDLQTMRANIEELEESLSQGNPNRPKSIDFHRLIANACHNRMVSTVMESVLKVFEDILSKVPMNLEDARGDLEYNKMFYKYILNRQKEEVMELMTAHFNTLMDFIDRNRSGDHENHVRPT
jgi:GntR family transcriptional repressor for pyruvate dehydrogenase complex